MRKFFSDLRAAATFCSFAELIVGFTVEDSVAVAGTARGSTRQAAAKHLALASADAVGDNGSWSAARGADLAGVEGSNDICFRQWVCDN